MALSHARLRELMDYDSQTGVFRWLVDRPGRFARAGTVAGAIRPDGRRQICVDRALYQANQLAVFWMTGVWPKKLVDHVNGIVDDNRWSNLRFADYSQNGANSRQKSMLPKGVTLKRPGQYFARIKVRYRSIYLGAFANPEDAHAAYVAAAQKYFGEFARFH